MGYRGTMPNSKSAVALFEFDNDGTPYALGAGVVMASKFVLTTLHCVSQKHENIGAYSAGDVKFKSAFNVSAVHIPVMNVGSNIIESTTIVKKEDFNLLDRFAVPNVMNEPLILLELENEFKLDNYPKCATKILGIDKINKTLVVLSAGFDSSNVCFGKSLIVENNFWLSELNQYYRYETKGFAMYPGAAERGDSGGPYIYYEQGEEVVVAIRVARDTSNGALRTALANAVVPYSKWVNKVIM